MSGIDSFVREFAIIKSFKETGQKQVYLSNHPKFGQVVLKIGKSPSEQRLKRAKREIEIQRSLESPFYPKIFDFLVFENFQFVMVEEFIESQPLSCCPERFKTPKSILGLLNSLVFGLNLLWTKKVIHRDIKPDNILIKKDYSPVIIDLGIILAIDKTDLTHPFAVRGPCTPAYSSPEQLINRRAEIDHRTDQFILGIDMMQLIAAGHHPFDPQSVRSGNSIPENIIKGAWNREPLEANPFVRMKPLMCKLLAPEPYQRFRTPDQFKREILNCMEAYE